MPVTFRIGRHVPFPVLVQSVLDIEPAIERFAVASNGRPARVLLEYGPKRGEIDKQIGRPCTAVHEDLDVGSRPHVTSECFARHCRQSTIHHVLHLGLGQITRLPQELTRRHWHRSPIGSNRGDEEYHQRKSDPSSSSSTPQMAVAPCHHRTTSCRSAQPVAVYPSHSSYVFVLSEAA